MTLIEKKGKNFSGVNRGQRKKSDFYETPFSITSQFLDVANFDKTLVTLEPACGENAIVKVLEKYGFNKIVAYDKEVNFLTETKTYDQVITNPPFSLADEFILKAKQVANKRIAMLLPLSYLHGKKRFDKIWTDKSFPLKEIYVFTRYPLLGDALREDGKYKTGMMVYAWYVWEREYTGEPSIKWIDNNKYVVGSK